MKNTDLVKPLLILQGQSLYYEGKNSSSSSFKLLAYGGLYDKATAITLLNFYEFSRHSDF